MFGSIQTSSKTISKLARPNAPLGYGLCFLNLAFDGFTNATQDSITARYSPTEVFAVLHFRKLTGVNALKNMTSAFHFHGYNKRTRNQKKKNVSIHLIIHRTRYPTVSRIS